METTLVCSRIEGGDTPHPDGWQMVLTSSLYPMVDSRFNSEAANTIVT